MALPTDPVIAADGHIYERSAVEEWIAKGNGKSPKTNEPMDRKLLPAPHIRSMIERMVKSGALTGDKAEAWQARLAEEEEVRELRADAEGGSATAMFNLALLYRTGGSGLKQDDEAAFRWFMRGADGGDTEALAAVADCYLDGLGVDESIGPGMSYLTQAAMCGSELACRLLGRAMAEGEYGMPENPKQATKWYRKMGECESTGASTDDDREEAAAWLREHATD